jgi:hypothetical protein
LVAARAAQQATGLGCGRPPRRCVRNAVQWLQLRPFHPKLHLALALPLVHIEAEGQQHGLGRLLGVVA